MGGLCTSYSTGLTICAQVFFSFFRDKQTQLHSVQFSGRRPFYIRVSSGTFVFSTYPVKTTKAFKMCAKMAFTHQPGTAMECLSIPITLTKESATDTDGRELLKCGFKIGGGIDQDFRKSPQGYTDNGIYVTEVHDGSPASRSGLRIHDKILQCNGYDFTMVTHKKAVDYIKKHKILNLLVARRGVTST